MKRPQFTMWVLILAASVSAAQNTASVPGSENCAIRNSPRTNASQEANPKSTADGAPLNASGGADCAPHAPSSKPAAEFPDAPYVPLSGRQKFNIFLKSTHSPYTFFSAAFGATLAQAEGQQYGYGGGMEGWGKRFGASLADTEARRFIQSFALSTALHQDPRYFHSTKRKLIPRAWYAATRVVVTKADNGSQTFNSSEFLGALFGSSLQNAYYPEADRGFAKTMTRFVGALGSDASTNLLREFWPDMRRIFRKHEPEKIKKIEQKIPAQVVEISIPQ
jgi:hypothetical protein